MAEKLGIEGVIAQNNGTYELPSWSVINCRDLRSTRSKSEADHSSRASRIKRSRGAMIELGVEFDIIWDPASTVLTDLQSWFWNHTAREFFIADGPPSTSGTKGVRMTCEIHGFDKDEPLEEGQKLTITLKPFPNAANPPAPFTVPS